MIVVDDETDARELMLAALRRAAYDAVGFGSPMAALDATEPDSHVLVPVTRVDFGPRMLNGLALVRRLNHKCSAIRTAFIGRGEHEQHTEGVGLLLPLDPGPLIDTVSYLLVAEKIRE